jgi:Ran GTPase-activating protein (RanGAP) involved in mRNA processing and transport
MRDGGARAIAAGVELSKLSSLDVSSSKIGDAGISALAASSHLQQLEQLDVQSNQFGIAGLRALVAAFPALRSLAIQVAGRAQLRVLVDSELARRLDRLEISGSQLDDRAISVLAAAELPNLRQLSLYSNRIGPAGAKTLAKSKSFAKLVALELGHNALGYDGVRAIAASGTLGNLVELGLGSTRIEQAGVRALAASRTLHCLEDLDLSGNQLRDDDIAILAAGRFPALRRLDLDWNPLTAGAAIAIAKWGVKLESLVLSHPVDQHGDDDTVGIGDDGARALAGARKLAGLRYLNLSANRIGDAGALAIAASPHLARLETLELKWNYLGKAACRAIAKRFGKRASVVHQRTLAPPPPPPPPPEPTPNVAPPPSPAERRRVLRALAKQRAFAAWKPSVDKAIVDAAEAIARETAEALLALAKPTRAAEAKLLRRYIARFDALDASDHFIGTIEVEDIGERFDELRFATALADDDLVFDAWRDF